MANTVFRYVGLAVEKNGRSFLSRNEVECQHTREFEIDKALKIGEILDYYDNEDGCYYGYRILRTEGTVYNKDPKQLAREKEKEEAVA